MSWRFLDHRDNLRQSAWNKHPAFKESKRNWTSISASFKFFLPAWATDFATGIPSSHFLLAFNCLRLPWSLGRITFEENTVLVSNQTSKIWTTVSSLSLYSSTKIIERLWGKPSFSFPILPCRKNFFQTWKSYQWCHLNQHFLSLFIPLNIWWRLEFHSTWWQYLKHFHIES